MNRLGAFLYRRRNDLLLGSRDLCRLIETDPDCPRKISPSYYSQIECGKRLEIAADYLWAIGKHLKVDPVKLLILLRPEINQAYLNPEERDKLFDVR